MKSQLSKYFCMPMQCFPSLSVSRLCKYHTTIQTFLEKQAQRAHSSPLRRETRHTSAKKLAPSSSQASVSSHQYVFSIPVF